MRIIKISTIRNLELYKKRNVTLNFDLNFPKLRLYKILMIRGFENMFYFWNKIIFKNLELKTRKNSKFRRFETSNYVKSEMLFSILIANSGYTKF